MFLLKALTPPGHEVLLIDGNAKPLNDEELVRFLREENIGLVGIGAMTRMVQKAYRVADAIRAAGVPVVMGGPHVTECPDEALGRDGGPRHADAVALGEADDMQGNPTTMLLNNAHWDMPVTENPKLGSTEIWNLLNFTDDSHPIHLHMVRFQILDRRSFEPEAYYHDGKIQYIGDPIPPAANEAGWKDTVRADPAIVTRIIVKFEGFAGRYVWHCHMLEHEDNEMMRPYLIRAV